MSQPLSPATPVPTQRAREQNEHGSSDGGHKRAQQYDFYLPGPVVKVSVWVYMD